MGNIAQNQPNNAQPQTAPQSQDSGEMALAILQSAIGDGAARESAAEQKPAENKGSAGTEDAETPEGDEPDASDENPIAVALAKKEAPPEKALQNQHAALTRRQRALEAEEKRLEQRQAEIESKHSELEQIDDIASMVEFVAKKRGINTAEVWEDVVDQIKNGGKRSSTNRVVRAVEDLRRDIKGGPPKTQQPSEQADEPSQEAVEQAAQDWKSAAVETAQKSADKWPTMSRLHPRALAAAAYEIAEEYFQTTGIVATHEQVLDYLESHAKAEGEQGNAPAAPNSQPAPAAGNGGAKARTAPKSKAKTISNSDASEAPDTREMSQEERNAAALRLLEQSLA